MKSGQIL